MTTFPLSTSNIVFSVQNFEGKCVMRLSRRTVKKARIEIIPMIDTIFFLLVFFMISTLSMARYSGLPVNLPKAATGQQPASESVAVTITSDGKVFSSISRTLPARTSAPCLNSVCRRNRIYSF